MADEWREVALDDVAREITVGHVGPMASEYVPRGIPFLRSQNVDFLRINTDDVKYITLEFHERLRKSALSPGDVVIVRTGKPGTCAVIPPWLPIANCSDLVIVRCGDELDARFLSYYINSIASQHVAAHLVGAVQQHFNVGSARTMRLKLPAIEEQQAITHMLGTLDDKIELNRRMNETLEAIARAIFKSWFVDFDPVRAKASGEAPESICQRLGLTPDLLALFPDRLVDSELGEIPEGWPTASLYEMATYINGAAYKAFEPNEVQRGLPIIKIAELKAGVTAQTKYSDVEMPEKYRINRGDILFSWSGNPDTSIDTFVWTNGPAWLNQHIFRVVPHSELERPFVLAMLKYLRPIFAEIARNKQTTGLGHVTVSDLKRLQCVKPPKSLLVSWNEVIGPVLEKAFLTGLETQTLANTRDGLLPRLLSGELRVPVVGEA